jgi:hypothetical protein
MYTLLDGFTLPTGGVSNLAVEICNSTVLFMPLTLKKCLNRALKSFRLYISSVSNDDPG